ncbi:Multi antimicrobial extrusion protein (Na(+)/drug antiporter), MATE family of MDR efflux pumps [hydrothermal vent metagenome]|uniref:Multi antimicrobial extrusion protein (Na(+)/drug antiporter), MATE family of MDR efflux pumps n=1 Tax=hydrothermal vent metagenome TaxID=652676 RepID=A0A3B0SNC3_9ZZZZ
MLAAFRSNPRDKAIAALAIPALGTLAIDPLVSIVDTVWVGRLGAEPLASIAIASAVFVAIFSIFNFVQAAVTPLVAGEVGRGDTRAAGAVATGSIVVAFAIGVVIAAAISFVLEPLVAFFGADASVAEGAAAYLQIRFLALPAVLVVMVGHGVYRGHSDTRTPLVVAVGMNVVNLVLDPILIFGVGLGVTGAAWATLVAQTIAAVWFLVLIFGVHRHRLGTDRLPHKVASLPIGRIVGAGWPMMIRSSALLLAISATTVAASRIGTQQVAAHQIAMQVWLFLSFVLDSFAIAATALIGTDLGAGDRSSARDVANRLLALGVISGIALSVLLAVTSPIVMTVFSSDPGVQSDLRSIYPFVVLLQPLTALVYVWDGIGLGASAFRFLAGSMVVAGVAAGATLMLLGNTLTGVWLAVLVLTVSRLVALAWWHRNGTLSSARDPSPSSQAT